jgi:hypothetical protein
MSFDTHIPKKMEEAHVHYGRLVRIGSVITITQRIDQFHANTENIVGTTNANSITQRTDQPHVKEANIVHTLDVHVLTQLIEEVIAGTDGIVQIKTKTTHGILFIQEDGRPQVRIRKKLQTHQQHHQRWNRLRYWRNNQIKWWGFLNNSM